MLGFLKVKIHFIVYLIFCLAYLSCSFIESDSSSRIPLEDSCGKAIYPNEDVTDGPYIFNYEDALTVKWVEQDSIIEFLFNDNDYSLLESNFGITLNPDYLSSDKAQSDYIQDYKKVKKFIAVSDIHGQYFLFTKLLRKYGVIDEDNNWNYGKGHLIINGDIFDRGDMVNEILWLVYKLEMQAEAKKGKVHYLYGNHEMMILKKDLRYVNEKYLRSAELMNIAYDQLYSENTVLGEWLRTKPLVVTINDIVFSHSGISPALVEKGISKQNINRIFQNDIIGKDKEVIEKDSILKFLAGRQGPLWYRGYFNDTSFNEQKLDDILKYFNKKHIIVGHTTQDSILSLYGGKIFAIDAGIKRGKTGEVLIYRRGKFYRGTLDSGKIRL